MELRNQVVKYLYDVSKVDSIKYTKASELLSTFRQSHNCTEEEFYQALKYLEDKKYIRGETASFRITGEGIDHVEKNILNVIPNYEREGFKLQQKSNKFEYYGIVISIIAIIITVISRPSVGKTPAQTPTIIVSAPLGINLLVSFDDDDVDPNVWFNKPYQLMSNYLQESINTLPGDGDERKISYYRIYRHPDDCQSNDIRGVLVQVIFFDSDAGSKEYFNDKKESTIPVLTNFVGEQSYFREDTQADDHCNYESSEHFTLLFQRYNAIGIIKTWTHPNSNNASIQEWLNQIAKELDSTFIEYSH